MSDRPDDLRRQFGALLKTALYGFDTVRDVVVRSSQTGRLRVDIVLLRNERGQLLQQLGESAMKLFDDGTFDEAVTEQLKPLHDEIRDVEARIRSDAAKATDNAFGAPRGFEPEAAADYGNDDRNDDDHAAKPAGKSRAPKRKRPVARTSKTR